MISPFDPLHCPRNRTGTSLHRCELCYTSEDELLRLIQARRAYTINQLNQEYQHDKLKSERGEGRVQHTTD